MKKCLLIVFLLCGAALAETPKHDGYWWKALSYDQKHSYVVGFADGMEMSRALAKVYLKRVPAPEKALVLTDCDITNITFGQLEDGLDQFYSDYRNTMIETETAMLYVRDGIRGMSQTRLDSELINLRKDAATASASPPSTSH